MTEDTSDKSFDSMGADEVATIRGKKRRAAGQYLTNFLLKTFLYQQSYSGMTIFKSSGQQANYKHKINVCGGT